jgi:cation diffusion facilitator CzcD-associated flavoprotein CzcO
MASWATEVKGNRLVAADASEREVDTIVLGTGFATTDLLAPMAITGLRGQNLREVWSDGAEAYMGICVSGLPNLFILYGPNTNLGHNSVFEYGRRTRFFDAGNYETGRAA